MWIRLEDIYVCLVESLEVSLECMEALLENVEVLLYYMGIS